MEVQTILDGVENAVKTQWPESPLYQDFRPKGYVRPSFLLQGGPIDVDELGGSQEQTKVQVRLTHFTKVDAYGNSKSKELRETVDALIELFRGGYIKIGNRAPHVTHIHGDYGFDYAEVTVNLEFFENTISRRAAANAHQMKQIHTRHDKE